MTKLIHEFDIHADLSVEDVGVGPFGERAIFTHTGGSVTGDRLTGSIVGASADWLLRSPDGFGRHDARFSVRTADGALIYVQCYGVVERTPEIRSVVAGGNRPTDFGDQYFFIIPRLEAGDERYSWVNQTIFIGQGRLVPGPAVEYRVFRVDN